MIKTPQIILVIVLIAIIASVFWLESRKPDTSNEKPQEIAIMSKEEKAKMYAPAKEISSPDAFINTSSTGSGQAQPITIKELIGKKVILVDFWTYSCINCQRTLPYLNEWYEKYAGEGLEILGIHTPEFEFEKDLENVKKAVEKYDIKYPVILDNDYSTWRSYENRYWPRKYLIDVDGYIVYDHIGEGGYAETEAKIVELLSELNDRKIELKENNLIEKPQVDFTKVKSPEMYLGSSRIQYLGNLPNENCFVEVCDYTLPQTVYLNNFAFEGKWQIEAERALLLSETGKIALKFSASKVNLVAGGVGGEVTAQIYLDGKPIDQNSSGSDVKNGEVTFSSNDLYNLVDLRGNYGEHLLEINLNSSNFEGFAFTFG